MQTRVTVVQGRFSFYRCRAQKLGVIMSKSAGRLMEPRELELEVP